MVKDKVITLSFVIFIILIMGINLFSPDKDVSKSERRKLEKFPEFKISRIFDGTFFKKFDKYTLDQFVFRDEFRNLKALTEFNVLKKKDNNNIFLYNNSIYDMKTSINDNGVNSFVNKLNSLDDKYFKNNDVYYSIIPDKSFYLDSNSSYLKFDYIKMFNMIHNKLNDNFKYIDVTNTLNSDSYYKSDLHFKQESIFDTASTLLKGMSSYNNKLDKNNFVKYDYYPFYGAYYSRLGLMNNKDVIDTISYYTNNEIENAKVFNYEKNKYGKVYTKEYLNNIDSYDVFLQGATALLTITNDRCNNNNELVIFRDSFGSSITPLFISNFSKIHVIDIRYINSNIIENYIKFNDDMKVLFLYSTEIIQNGNILK